ncbi:tRNA/rRNA methyltransferase [Mesomycoplasma conjunctivae]|nr:tRNA/rRNA methyltransferase [Mesomycoplasma conjunctivae]
MKEISSLNNPIIKKAYKLQHKKYRQEYKLFLVENWKEIEIAYQNSMIEWLFLTKELLHLVANWKVDIYLVSNSILEKISQHKSAAKIIAICKIPESKPLSYFYQSKRLVLIENIQDPGNLGTIIRSSQAFNFDIVYSGVDLFNSKVISAAKGSLFNVNILKLNNLVDFFVEKKYQQKIVGTVVDKSAILLENFLAKCDQKYAIVLGNEGQGLSKFIKKYLDYSVYVKIEFESLNIAICHAIFCNHFTNNCKK